LETEGVKALCRECANDVLKAGTTTEALMEAAERVLPQSHVLADRLIAYLTK